MRRAFLGGLILMAAVVSASEKPNPLSAWKEDVEIRPVLPADSPFHSIHTYFNANPESPDGKFVLIFRSADPAAHLGEICIVERATGKLRVLAEEIETEDAHRVACQQWAMNGKAVVFHAWRKDQWWIGKVDIESGVVAYLAPGWQLGFCRPDSVAVPICGPHSNPGENRDVRLLDLQNGELTTAVSIDSVRPAWKKTSYAEYFEGEFGDRAISICFPMLSPDGKRLYFKLALPGIVKGFRSPLSSRRLGIFSYDLEEGRYLFLHGKWGHPAWHPDSRHLINMWSNGPVLVDLESGEVKKKLTMPEGLKSGGHPALSPDGRLFVTDGQVAAKSKDGDPSLWRVALGNFEAGEWHSLTEFDNSKGATSWRRNHPHPVFSADGKRIYFNTNSGEWTRLMVAERRSD